MLDDFFDSSNQGSVVDVPVFFDSRVPDGIARLVSLGVLVSVGTTRDRGAISITVTTDGKHRREYFRDSSDAIDFLGQAIAALGGGGFAPNGQEDPGTQRATRGRRKAL